MRSRRASYLPITSIVIGIVVLAAAVGAVSFRDIARGRRQVAEVLERQALAVVRFIWADLRAELAAPNWQRERLDLFFENAGAREDIAYLAVLDIDGRVVLHSDPARIGTAWPEDRALGVDPETCPTAGRFVTVEGRSVFQLAAVVELCPAGLAPVRARHFRRPGPPGVGALPFVRPPCQPPDAPAVIERLSDLLGRPIDSPESVCLIAVVGIDSSELEAAFLASRNHTIMLSSVLLAVGGVAIYFLFVLAHYRSARTALANMQSYTTNVIESMASGLISVDAGGRVVTVNSRAKDLLSLEGEALEGRPLADVVTLEPDLESAGVRQVLRGERRMLEAKVGLVAGGETIPVALAASSLRDEQGRHAGAVLLFQDMSEVEALKEEVERSRHLAALGRLAAGVAHEVRNPLSSLRGFAQLLRSKFRPGSKEERYADIMIEEVERLDRVVQELLEFARPVSPERRPSSANAIVEEALALVSEDALFKNVEIVRRLGDDLPAVYVDPSQVRQALLNVLLNAIEAMGGGGRLTVATMVSRDGEGPPFVRIDVTDTGDGMDADELTRLFEPFYTTKEKGTGLGLTIVSRLVEQNGGRVLVTSTKGEGSTFSILLPIAGGTPGDGPGSATSRPGDGDGTGDD